MAKTSGGVRSLGTRETAKNNRKNEFYNELATGKFNVSKSYFDDESGGYYLTEKSAQKHKSEEYEVAKILAKSGYKVTLVDEANTFRSPDGKIFKLFYEQRTPTGNSINNIKYALEHAERKNANVAVIYTKYGNHSRSVVEKGISEYERRKNRFDKILIIGRSGKIHIHKHNKT